MGQSKETSWKPHRNLMETSTNLSKTQSNGRVNLNIRVLPAWDLNTGCVLIPLGSPTGPQKRLLDHSVRRTAGGRWEGVPGWYGDRVGRGEGYTGYYPAAKDVPVKRSPDSEAGPGSPIGAGVGGQGVAPQYVRTHPSGPVGHLGALPGAPRAIPRLWANKGEISANLL